MAIIGIDLGTTNSLVCTLEADTPKLIHNASELDNVLLVGGASNCHGSELM
jgi:molecular chaperone DnaK (HSP70)